MNLLDKYVVTGGTTLAPKSGMNHLSLESAIRYAKSQLSSGSSTQSEMIIWKPYKIVRLKEVPVEVVDAPELFGGKLQEDTSKTPMPASDDNLDHDDQL